MELSEAIYIPRFYQYLSKSYELYQSNDAIIQELLEKPTQINFQIYFTDDSSINFQYLIDRLKSKIVKNSIDFIKILYNTGLSLPQKILIKKHEDEKMKLFNFYICKNSILISFFKIIQCATEFIQTKSKHKAKSVSELKSDQYCYKTENPEGNAQQQSDIFQLNSNVKPLKSSHFLKKNMNRSIHQDESFQNSQNSTNLSIDTNNFQQFDNNKLLDKQHKFPSEHLSTDYNNISDCQNITSSTSTSIQMIASTCQQLNADKKIYHSSSFVKKNELLINSHSDFEFITKFTNYNVIGSILQPPTSNNSANQNLSTEKTISEVLKAPEQDNLVILLAKGNNRSMFNNIENFKIMILPKNLFNNLLQLFLYQTSSNKTQPLVSRKNLQPPNGILCIKILALQRELENQRLLLLITLLKNCFQFFLYIFSEDSHQNQNEILLSLNDKLEILGQIIVDSSKKESKEYDMIKDRYVYTLPENKDNWHQHFQVEKNNLFFISENSSKVKIENSEDLLEFENLFQALHKIYEDQIVLKIFNNQISLMDKSTLFRYELIEFFCLRADGTAGKNCKTIKHFLLSENSDCLFFGKAAQSQEFDAPNKDYVSQFNKSLGLVFYFYFGVSTPHCCLSHQLITTNETFNNQIDNNDVVFYFTAECAKSYKPLPTTFISQYKNNNNNYYYYPCTMTEGPLIGFGIALFVAYLLGESHFFGDDFQNVGLIKKNKYIEFAKFAIENVFLATEETNTTSTSCGDIILAHTGEDKIMFKDLCEYDKFEFMFQVSKFLDSKKVADKIWDQFIDAKHKKEFNYIQGCWIMRAKQIQKLFSIKNQQQLSPSKYQNLEDRYSFDSDLDDRSMTANAIIQYLELKNNSFFIRECKYLIENSEIGLKSFGKVNLAYQISDPKKKYALKKLFDNSCGFYDKNKEIAGKKDFEIFSKYNHDKEVEDLIKIKKINSPFLTKYENVQVLINLQSEIYRLELVMELCDGNLLTYFDELKKKNMTLSLFECYNIFCQLVEGLYMLHKKGMVHRNIKPKNILYKTIIAQDENYTVWKMSDQGLISQKSVLLHQDNLEYEAPETREGKDYEKSADIWSLGLVFHRILFGYDYFSKNILKVDYQLLVQEENSIDKNTKYLLCRMIEKNIKNRIKIEEIITFLQERQEYEVIQKIKIVYKKDKSKKFNKNDFTSTELEKVESADRLKEIIENACEWRELGYINKSLYMLVKALPIIDNLSLSTDNNLLLLIYDNMACVLRDFDKNYEALQYFYKNLFIQIKIFGEESINLIFCHQKIANTFWSLCNHKQALKHIDCAIKICTKFHGLEHIQTAVLYYNKACTLYSLKMYEEALLLFNSTLKIRAENFGNDHFCIGIIHENIGITFFALGKYEEALYNHFCALKIYTKYFKENCLQQSVPYYNIGAIFFLLKNFQASLQYYNFALQARIKHYGDKHIETVILYKKIGSLLAVLKKNEKALQFYDSALDIYFKYNRTEDIDAIETNNSIGCILQSMNKNEEALPHFKKVFDKFILHYGDKHHKTLSACKTIGFILYTLDQWKESLEYYKSLLIMCINVNGSNHIQTADIYEKIGLLFYKLGKYKEGLQYFNISLEMKLKYYKNDHVEIISLYNNIACALKLLGKYEESLLYHNCILQERIKYYGNENIVTAGSYHNIGDTLTSQGDHEAALKYKLMALKIYIAYYGNEHKEIAPLYSNVGISLFHLKKSEEALSYFSCALKILIKNYGSEHIQSAKIYKNMGCILGSLSRYEDALQHFTYTLNIEIKNYGNEHIEVARTYFNVGNIYQLQHKYAEALQCFKYAFPIYTNFYGEQHLETLRLVGFIKFLHQELKYVQFKILFTINLKFRKLNYQINSFRATNFLLQISNVKQTTTINISTILYQKTKSKVLGVSSGPKPFIAISLIFASLIFNFFLQLSYQFFSDYNQLQRFG